jgi:hypothetical protein
LLKRGGKKKREREKREKEKDGERKREKGPAGKRVGIDATYRY